MKAHEAIQFSSDQANLKFAILKLIYIRHIQTGVKHPNVCDKYLVESSQGNSPHLHRNIKARRKGESWCQKQKIWSLFLRQDLTAPINCFNDRILHSVERAFFVFWPLAKCHKSWNMRLRTKWLQWKLREEFSEYLLIYQKYLLKLFLCHLPWGKMSWSVCHLHFSN
jgi:hypothetical protein